MSQSLTEGQLAALQRLETCTVANAIETFEIRLRNEGFTNPTIRCCTACRGAAVGYAATVRVRCSNPSTDGLPYVDRTDWWDYLLTVASPRFVVVQDVDESPGTGGFIGEVHASILKALGTVAIVTNGTVRDLPEIERLGMPIFASGLVVSHAYVHIVDFGEPVKIGGLTVRSGDLLHADVHGVLSVPAEIATKIPEAAAKIVEREKKVIELCDSPDFSISRLRDAVGAVFD